MHLNWASTACQRSRTPQGSPKGGSKLCFNGSLPLSTPRFGPRGEASRGEDPRHQGAQHGEGDHGEPPNQPDGGEQQHTVCQQENRVGQGWLSIAER